MEEITALNIEFLCTTNKDYCLINCVIFILKNGSTITIDRDLTDYDINNGKLLMTWKNCYIWEINGFHIFNDDSFYDYDTEELKKMLSKENVASIVFDIEDEADSDYVVTIVDYPKFL